MVKGFVFGKFYPFHKGHEAMIRFAQTQCDFLSVLVCASDQEHISADIRKNWIEQTFSSDNHLDVRAFEYLEKDLPNTSESSEVVSKLWTVIFKQQFPDYQLLITSEPYGEYVARFMDIQHILFDKERNQVPISASTIKANLFKHWQYLPESVRPFFVKKIVLLGTESTGKSTLGQQLAAYYQATLVSEAGRDIVEDSSDFAFSDLHIIAKEHAQRIAKAAKGNSPLVIIDTDIHITKSYALFAFQKELQVSENIYNINQADLYLYLNNDVKYVQDGTRMEEVERNLLDLSHRAVLQAHHIEFIEISGNWEERKIKAIHHINQLLHSSPIPLL